MAKFVICSLFCIALVVAGHANPTGRIVGGQDASEGQFPHQVSLRRNGQHTCGGSIISQWYILTAAHCVGTTDDETGIFTAYAPSVFLIRVGSIYRASGGSLVGVQSVKAHENYGNWLNDVALLKLQNPLIYSANINAAPLATREVPDEDPVIISGYGRLSTGGAIPVILQYNTLTAISRAECKAQINFDSDLLLCLAHPANNGACNGDSGGPAMNNGELVGVANFIKGGCGSVNADGYCKVFEQIDWITENSDL